MENRSSFYLAKAASRMAAHRYRLVNSYPYNLIVILIFFNLMSHRVTFLQIVKNSKCGLKKYF